MTKEEILSSNADVSGYFLTEKDGILEAMEQYAKQQAVEFFKWYGVKMVGFIEYVTKVKPLVRSEEIEAKIEEFEGKPHETLYSLFLEYQKQQ